MNNLKLIRSMDETISEGKKQLDWLSALLQINALLRNSSGFDEVYDKVIEIVTNLLDVESAGIILFSEDTNELIVQRTAFALNTDEKNNVRVQLSGRGQTVNVFQTGKPFISENCYQDASTFKKYANDFGVRNTAMVPLAVENRRIGVLHVYNKKDGPFTSEDQDVLLNLAANLAVIIENVRLYEREKKMLEALAKLNKAQAADKVRLQKLMEIHNQLIGKVLNGEGLPEIVKAFKALLHAPVIIEDRHFQLLAASEQMDGCKYSVRHLFGEKKSLERKLKSGQVVRYFPFNYRGVECTIIIAPIGDPRHIIGYMSVIMDPARAESEIENVALEQGTIVLALELMKEKIKNEVDARYRGQFLDDLLSGDHGSDESFFQRAEFIRYNLKFPIRVVVVAFKKNGKNILSGEINGHFIKRIFAELFPRCFIARKDNNLVVLVPVASSKDTHELTAGFKKVHDKITRQYPELNVNIGIGNVCLGLNDYRESYQQALQALTFSRPEVSGAQMIYYEELGVFGIFAEVKDQNVLSKFVESKIGPLLSYDHKKSQVFVETLEEYIKSGNSLKDASDTLHIHIGTLKYRLGRIREILEITEFNAETVFDLRVALYVNRFLSK